MVRFVLRKSKQFITSINVYSFYCLMSGSVCAATSPIHDSDDEIKYDMGQWPSTPVLNSVLLAY